MCKPASMVICDGGKRCVWSKNSDSHEEIINEFGLSEGSGRVNFVRVEISPADGALTTPLKQWTFATDQNDTPDWYDAKDAEKLARLELKKWHKQKVITKDAELKDGQFYVYSSSVEARGSSSVVAWDSSSVVAWDSSSVVAWDSSSVVAWDSSSVVAWDSSTVYVLVTKEQGQIKSASAVMIDRSVNPPKCYVGIQEKKP